MSIFITLIAALIVFSAVIAIHEFGHFTVAKLCGIQVNEFSIGMGPALWRKIYKGTQYSLRALPVPVPTLFTAAAARCAVRTVP